MDFNDHQFKKWTALMSTPTRRARGSISSKLRSIIKKGKNTSRDGLPTEDELPAETEPVEPCPFQLASSSLDVMVQARENLANFRIYLEEDPIDSFACYRKVSQSMARAFSEFTNRTADLKVQLGKAETAATDFDQPLQENQSQKAQLTAELQAAREETQKLRESLTRINTQKSVLDREISEFKALKRTVKQIQQRESLLRQKIADYAAALEKETVATGELEGQLAFQREHESDSGAALREELQQSEARIRELMTKAKKADTEEKEIQAKLQQRKSVPVVPPPTEKPSTFLIRDTVRISQGEVDNLIFMIKAIRKENAELTNDRNSKMVDIDCLMQENLGLKQLIRQISESTEQ
jgi:DNA repair exonuclease SbcCD ATPase subunit